MLTLSTVNDHVLKFVGVLPRMGRIRIDTFKKNSPGQKILRKPLCSNVDIVDSNVDIVNSQ